VVSEDSTIRRATAAMEPYLPELIGPGEADAFAAELAAASDDDALIAVVGQQHRVREWLADYLEAVTSSPRDYARLSGDPEFVPGLVLLEVLGRVETSEILADNLVRLVSLNSFCSGIPRRHISLRIDQEDCVISDRIHQSAKDVLGSKRGRFGNGGARTSRARQSHLRVARFHGTPVPQQ